MPITIQLSTENGIAPATVRWWTNCNFSHVDFVLPPGLKLPDGTLTEGGELLGARGDGVKVRPPNYMKFTKVQRYYFPGAPNSIYNYAITQIGKPYDYTAIFNFVVQNRNWRNDNAWYCSELVEGCCEHENYPLLRIADDDTVTPRDLTLSLLGYPITNDNYEEPWKKLTKKYKNLIPGEIRQ